MLAALLAAPNQLASLCERMPLLTRICSKAAFIFGSDRAVAALVVGSGLTATINDGIKSQERRTIDSTIVLDECCIVASIKFASSSADAKSLRCRESLVPMFRLCYGTWGRTLLPRDIPGGGRNSLRRVTLRTSGP